MSVASLTIYVDLRPEAPEGPGWYIFGTSIHKAFRVSEETAKHLAEEFATALRTVTSLKFKYGEVVETGNKAIEAELVTQLAFAEEQASRIAMLRKRLASSDIVEEADGTRS
jgi:hypothetical protein